MAQVVTTTPGVRGTRSEQADRRPMEQAKETMAKHALSARLPLIGLLAVQVFIGYEWFISGLVKIVRGGFPSGLADELTTKSAGASGWYASFLDNTVMPNAKAFGYMIEIGELLVGIALIATAVIWIFEWDRLPTGGRAATLAVIALTALAGAFMNVNFHLANGSAHPWLLPGSGFDEGVDLDTLMPLIQLAIAGVCGGLLLNIWRTRRIDVSTVDER